MQFMPKKEDDLEAEEFTLEEVSPSCPTVVMDYDLQRDKQMIMINPDNRINCDEEPHTIPSNCSPIPHPAIEEENNDESWKSNGWILIHIFVHSLLAAAVVLAVVLPINIVTLYDFYRTQPNATLLSLSVSQRIEYYSAAQLSSEIGFFIFAYTVLQIGLNHYQGKFLFYGRVWCVLFAFIMTIGVYVEILYLPDYQFFFLFVALHISCCFVFICLEARHAGRDTECVKRIAITGFAMLLGGAYASAVTFTQELSSTELFRWVSPFVIPFAAFLFRYTGQQSELPEMLIARGSACVGILSSVATRVSQCAFLTSNSNDIVTMFLALEIFYDVVGLIIRVTLYHRQLIIETILSGKFWKNGTFELCTQTPRNRLISSLTVAQSSILDYVCFIVAFVTRVSLTDDHLDVGSLMGIFLACSVLQMLCCFVSHLLIRKVEAVPLEELDVAVLPLRKLWESQIFYISLVVCFFIATSQFMYKTWFSMKQNILH